jgi:ATP-dependent exoDNAse (exonuclease V) alpha subunit
VISTIVNNLLSINKICFAPTGRAAKVIANYSEKPFTQFIKSISQEIFSGGVSFTLQQNKHKKHHFIVDEASMISDTASDSSMKMVPWMI